MTHRHTRSLTIAAAVAGIAALTLTGCVDAEVAETGTSAGASGLPADLVAAAVDKAASIADGEDLEGTTVSLVGTWGGEERERFLSTLAPFEEATGVTIDFTGNEDYETLQQTSLAAGTPIDVVAAGNLGTVNEYAGSDAIDLNELIGEDVIADNYAPGFIDSTTVDGGNYGLWTMVDNYMIWYDPSVYEGPAPEDLTWDDLTAYTDSLAGSGTAAWCMGLSAGANTGWPGSYFVFNLMLKEFGPDLLTGLADGTHAWDSDEVRASFARFGEVVADDQTVLGGPDAVLTTDPGAVGAGMYTDPQQCALEHWGTYTASIILGGDPSLEPGTDLDFMEMPSITPEYAGANGYGGTVFTAFADRPEVAAFMEYMASVESSDLIASTGNWIGANANIDAEAFPNSILAGVSEQLLTGSDQLVPFPIASTPSAVTAAFYTTVAEFVQDPASLDQNLAAVDAAVAAN
ncbi:hypothetical protein GRS96_04510 [Rathayibacter sp. VKM Ac-2803]|uniref:ABC transporter substrate-binding protein n=1 Tax=Rathayibacter sp. VKM Ac-2803 TaxID=2609256 RepID=UPI001358EB18|nr:hypothetical protein [Rathayibacter sp. VKM Ac-2803]MWV48538.1 hypothetical protein [Rathayibacter sp. VKM Ac-2803]